jgi:hypothetical protein
MVPEQCWRAASARLATHNHNDANGVERCLDAISSPLQFVPSLTGGSDGLAGERTGVPIPGAH